MLRWVATIIGALLALAGLIGVLAHYCRLLVASRIAPFTPALVGCALLGLVMLALARRRVAATVTAAVVAAGIGTQVPLFVGDASADENDLVVMQANIYLGRADVAVLADTVINERVDVLTVIELTDAALTRIKNSAITDRLGYSYTAARPGGHGAGVFSRFPLTGGEVLDQFELGSLRVEAEISGRGRYAVYALHPLPPWPEPARRWAGELDQIATLLAAEQLPTVIGSDMNSTLDHRRFRDLLSGSSRPGSPQLLDAAAHTGAGWVPTYPADRWIPPVLAIDHIMTRNGPVPDSIHTVSLPGSDHRGVVATVR